VGIASIIVLVIVIILVTIAILIALIILTLLTDIVITGTTIIGVLKSLTLMISMESTGSIGIRVVSTEVVGLRRLMRNRIR
jgi:hypothetical protein